MTNSISEMMGFDQVNFNQENSDQRTPHQNVSDQHNTALPESSHATANPIFERLKGIVSIAELIRIFGACVVIASMSLFLLEGWSEGNDIQRYLKLLAQTGSLTAGGLALSFILKEHKGARLFFALSLVSVVSNFTLLGALIYSLIQFDNLLLEYPKMLLWVAVNPALFWPVCGGALMFLAIVARFAFGIFSRNIAGALTVWFLLLNGLLLIPVRNSFAVSVLLLVATFAAAYAVKYLSKKDNTVLTLESKFALASLFIPGLIIVARSLSLYLVDAMILIELSGLAYFALRSLIARMTEASFIKRVVEIAQFCLGIHIAFQVVNLIPSIGISLNPVIFSLFAIGFAADQIVQSSDKQWRTSILGFTTSLLVIGNLGLALMSDDLVVKIGSFVVSLLSITFANRVETRVTNATASRLVACSGAAISLCIVIIKVVGLIHLSGWTVMGMTGMLLIIAASFYERFGLTLTARLLGNKAEPN